SPSTRSAMSMSARKASSCTRQAGSTMARHFSIGQGPLIVALARSKLGAAQRHPSAAFRKGLGQAGFVEGENLAIAFRWAEGHFDRLPGLAAELVGLHVALIFAAGGQPSAFAAKAATSTIPIVFSAVSDPVEIGLIASL